MLKPKHVGKSVVFEPHYASRVLRLSSHEGSNRQTSSELGLFEHEVYLDAVVLHDFSAVPQLEKHWGPLVIATGERLRDTLYPLGFSSHEEDLQTTQVIPVKNADADIPRDLKLLEDLAFDVIRINLDGYRKTSRWGRC